MLDLFHIAKPQNCDIQTFYGDASSQPFDYRFFKTWNKPRGVSHVYMLLIGAGGDGNGTTNGGGSGGVTVWYGAAQHVPDVLYIYARQAVGATDTTVQAKTGDGQFYTLLAASTATNPSGGASKGPTAFSASGFYQSTQGQGGATGAVSPSPITFLSGGAGTTGADVVANYGYDSTATNAKGYFLTRPIMVGLGGSGSGVGGIGCGGGVTGSGGQGMVLIASW